MDANGHWHSLMGSKAGPHDVSASSVARFLIIGAGSRGHGYAKAIVQATAGIVAAVAEPIAFKRQDLGRRYIWHESGKPSYEQEFDDWAQFVAYETSRRKRAAAGEQTPPGVDGAFVCTLDEQHAEIVRALAPLGLHIMCEKPLATTWDDCLSIYKAMRIPEDEVETAQPARTRALFGIGHVLRYSPHNMLLRELLLQDGVIGDIISIEHTEPVGWWHFSHSYVRGNWRKERTTAPSLLTKSCHDIDLLLWLLSSPSSQAQSRPALPPHLPSYVSSTGQLNYFRQLRKPAAAGAATNCLSCPIESSCMYSAKKIYVDRQLKHGRTDWPVKIVNPEIEDCYQKQGEAAATQLLLKTLSEDYDVATDPPAEIERRPWFGRCVWESDNDVCDDQIVTMSWDDDPLTSKSAGAATGRWSKTAIFHMIANTEAQCERRGRVYGTKGEVSYDSQTIRVFDFATGEETMHHPHQPGGGHGGGDEGLTRQFVLAVEAVKSGKASVEAAQLGFIGCSLDDIIRSHGMVFAAEEARRSRSVVDWPSWWAKNVESRLQE